MMIYSISNLNLFKIIDDSMNKIYYGCSQEWYATEWQRLSGCGPTAASNIISYLNRTCSTLELGQSPDNKINCISLMEEIWAYITPTTEGVNTTKMFYEAVLIYTKSKGLNVEFEFCDLPEDKTLRPELAVILTFLKKALANDAPIAFLNLCNGEEKNLEQWHWVTIISLECSEDGKSAFIKILDEGQIKKIDLALWYNTTTLGGGFVYFTAAPV
jgi:hypothetical protein